jgi:hypothetical protein
VNGTAYTFANASIRRESSDSVNVRDPWVEAYIEALERWRIQANAQGVLLRHLRDARAAYKKYRATTEPFFRYSSWSSVQAAAASLASLPHNP